MEGSMRNMSGNMELLVAIKRRGRTQREVARAAGLSESALSMAINGRLNLNGEERRRIARALELQPAELFPGVENGQQAR
jgi:transcriptional regulator with XRE-family HTH domain